MEIIDKVGVRKGFCTREKKEADKFRKASVLEAREKLVFTKLEKRKGKGKRGTSVN